MALVAYTAQVEANRPVGEGELFAEDAATATAIAAEAGDADLAVREIRNDLRVEAVSFVDSEGVVTASTSASLDGYRISNGVLRFGLGSSSLVAVAATIEQEIEIDGVVEWDPGDVLYRVLLPSGGGAVLLDYDIERLLARRATGAEVSGDALRIGLLALLFGLITLASIVGRSRTARHYREAAREAELLRAHAEELEVTNLELTKARHRAEEALELAEETNRIRAEFVLMINHELRTPLTAVVTGADLLRTDQSLPDEIRAQILDAMASDGARLEEMIDHMLVAARIENRGLNVEFGRVERSEICAAVVSSHHGLHHEAHNETVELPAWTDATTLTQLLHSLVDNAHTHGASTVSLECTAGLPFEPLLEVGLRPHNPVTFIVSDDGPGIDAEFLPRIFEKFEKQSFSSGTGLGLYLARMMVDALGGSIAVTTSSAGTRMAVSVEAMAHPSLTWSGLREAAS